MWTSKSKRSKKMFYLGLLFLSQGLFGILMLIFLHKINQMKKQIEDITKEVKAYLDFVEEDIKQESIENTSINTAKKQNEEDENRLIQAVLREYFP